jgi:hypothetical protein
MSAERRLELEAERLRVVHCALHGAPPPPSPAAQQPKALAPKSEERDPCTQLAVSPPPPRRVPPKLPELYGGHYLVDFGYVTKGTNKTRKVKLINTSTNVTVFAMDTTVLQAFGFGVSPDTHITLKVSNWLISIHLHAATRSICIHLSCGHH